MSPCPFSALLMACHFHLSLHKILHQKFCNCLHWLKRWDQEDDAMCLRESWNQLYSSSFLVQAWTLSGTDSCTRPKALSEGVWDVNMVWDITTSFTSTITTATSLIKREGSVISLVKIPSKILTRILPGSQKDHAWSHRNLEHLVTSCYILTRSYQDFYGISQVARFRKILEHTPPNLVTSC